MFSSSLPKLSTSPLSHLSPRSQQLFLEYATGPLQEPPFKCVHHAFEAQAESVPNFVAVETKERSVTYAELNTQAAKIAATLRELGVGAPENVGLFIQRGIEYVAGILGILKCGAAYVPQHVGVAPDSQLKHIAKVASVKVILTSSAMRSKIPPIEGVQHVLSIEEILNTPDLPRNKIALFEYSGRTFDVRAATPSSNCFLIFTSGTTGTPKGVQVMHGNVSNVILTTPMNLGMGPGVRVAQMLSIAFDMGAWETLGAVCNGATLVIRGRDFLATARSCNVLISTPTILGTLDAEACRQNVRVVAVAGEPCPYPLAEKWASFCEFYNSCGPTETTIVNTAHRHVPGSTLMSIGKPISNNTVYILDQKGHPLEIGETGEMWAGGRCVTAGYLDLPALTEKRYIYDPFLDNGSRMYKTGDLGRWTDEGTLEHLGRCDDQVKVKGFRVELDGISAVLESVEGVQKAIALKQDERIVAAVAPKFVDISAAKRAVAAQLPYYCVPDLIAAVETMPITPNGKVDKTVVRRIIKEEYLQSGNDEDSIISISPKALDFSRNFKNPADVETLSSTQESSSTQEEEEKSIASTLDSMEAGVVIGKSQEGDAKDGKEQSQDVVRKRPLLSRLGAYVALSQYRRLAAFVAFVNILLLIIGGTQLQWWSSLPALANLVFANLFVAIVLRQPFVINLLFGIVCLAPVWLHVNTRWALAKIYHFGGLHSSCAVAGATWFAIFTGRATYEVATGRPGVSIATTVMSFLILALLIGIVILALPSLRQKYHNSFETTHRLGGWSVLLLVWVHVFLFTNDIKRDGQNYGVALVQNPGFWLMIIITGSIISPWLRLRRVPVEVVKPSNHAVIVRFNHGVTPFVGSSTQVSLNPLREWHSFANIPTPGESGFRLIISRAGDWTGAFINNPPSSVWVKSIPTAGVARIETLFTRVLYVATGSGIGPVLPHLLAKRVPCRLIWTTRTPRETYGDALVDEIEAAEPSALIHDTVLHGKPDMVALSLDAVRDFRAEAVICISNQKLTRKVVYGMESRGIPAFGAIWDS